MPELPEVETVCQGLNQQTRGQRIGGGQVLLERTLAHPPSIEAFWAGVTATTLAGWQRRGKYLLASLRAEGFAGWLGVHLRMSGQLLWLSRQEPLQPHARLRLFVGRDRELRFVDMRTFGQVWWVPPNSQPETVMTGLQKLGPDPLSSEFSSAYLAQQLQHRRCPIKNALLNQSIAAGLGNIYADEALFASGLHPQRAAYTLSDSEIERLHAAIGAVLQAGIERGGSSFGSFLNVLGVNGNYTALAWVYGREGDRCRTCAGAIHRIKLTGRSAHFCPTCQR